MADVRWTLQAAEDLEAITNYIAVDSAQYAKLFTIDMLSVVERRLASDGKKSLKNPDGLSELTEA